MSALSEKLACHLRVRKDAICSIYGVFADMRHLLAPARRESPWIKGLSFKSPTASELQGGLSWRITAKMGGGAGVCRWRLWVLCGSGKVLGKYLEAGSCGLSAPFGRLGVWLQSEHLQICRRFLRIWDAQQRQGHLSVGSNVEYHAGDSVFCVAGCSCLSGP